MTGHFAIRKAGFIGFDHILNELERISEHALDHYPPHNIVKYDEDNFAIEIAVAGFKKGEIDCELKDGILTVSGEHKSQGREMIHRGISTKKFSREFRLSEHTQVSGAKFEDGLLVIRLKVVIPEEQRPRKINIK
tara:strand:- start:30 stop:434 length:405 start_codon:yes stop_codon:yes gene_type:complete